MHTQYVLDSFLDILLRRKSRRETGRLEDSKNLLGPAVGEMLQDSLPFVRLVVRIDWRKKKGLPAPFTVGSTRILPSLDDTLQNVRPR